MRPITHVVIHHAGRDGATVESIRRTHVVQNGWSDIGYHQIVYPDGSVHPGRPEARPGAHTTGFNAPTLAVCMAAHLGKHPPTSAQLEATVCQVAKWCKQYGLTAYRVIGHRETRPFVKPAERTKKDCPGKFVDMDSFRARLAEVLRDG